MKPKKKANELVELFYQNAPDLFGTSKAMEYPIKTAILCVDELIKSTHSDSRANSIFDKEYWYKVKIILENKL